MIQKQPYKDKIIWIIGASSGIGESLAKELAARGAVLSLSARHKDALERLKKTLKGHEHKIFILDVTDSKSLIATAQIIRSDFGRIDSIIFLAASYTPMKLDALNMELTQEMINVNLLGAFHTVNAVLPILKEQSCGQIALCGSIAGYVGLPGGQPYSATKAGITNLAESLHAELPRNIDVKLISPGFVRTALTNKNDFYMPLIIPPEQAAIAIANGLLKRGFEVHFPKRFTYWMKILQLLPYRLSLKITCRFNR